MVFAEGGLTHPPNPCLSELKESRQVCTGVNKTLKVVLLFITPPPTTTTAAATCCQCFASSKRLECKWLIISHRGLRGLRNFSNENFSGKAKGRGREKKQKKQGSFSLSLPVTDCKAIRHCPRTSVGACARRERGGETQEKNSRFQSGAPVRQSFTWLRLPGVPLRAHTGLRVQQRGRRHQERLSSAALS